MADNMHIDILRRMVGQRIDEVAQSPLTSSRAVRMALTKAAYDTVGLAVTVKSVEEVMQPLDEMLNGLANDLMLVDLQRQGLSAGLIALDMQMRAVVLEMQTVGQLAKQAAEDRGATGTDKRMCEPFLDAFLQALPQAVIGTEFEGWLDAVSHHRMVASPRAAGLILDDRDYRVLRLTVDLGVADREGQVLIALPLTSQREQPGVDLLEDIDWESTFRDAVCEAATVLNAELHRFKIPLSQADNLKVGDVLALDGCTVSSVRLRALDGHVAHQARLGQFGGRRAVRIEAESPPLMGELAAIRARPLPNGIGASRGSSSSIKMRHTDKPMVNAKTAVAVERSKLTEPQD